MILALALLAAILCFQAFHKKYNQQLHLTVVKELEKLFPDSSVYVGYVAKQQSGKLVITDICLAEKNAHPKRKVFSAQRAVLSGALELTDVLQQQVRLTQIELYGAQLHVWPTNEGWSIDALRPKVMPNKGTPPTVLFQQASVQLYKDDTPEASVITLHDIQGRFREVMLNSKAGRAPVLVMEDVRGRGSGRIDQFSLQTQIDPRSKAWRVTGKANGLQLGPKLYQDLPSEFSTYLTQAAGLNCEADAGFDVYQLPNQPTAFKLRGSLKNGRLQDRRLPYALEKLSGDFRCENTQLQLRNLLAVSDKARLKLNVDMDGLQLNSPMRIAAEVFELSLDQRLYQSLPINLKEQWDRLQLAGQVSGRVWLEFDGSRWHPMMTVNCKDVSIRPWLFPYPIQKIQGVVKFHDSPPSVSAEHLVGEAEGQQASGSFSLSKSGDQWVGHLKCQTHGLLSVDEILVSSLTERGKSETGAEHFVRSLKPTGTIELKNAEFWRTDPDQKWHKKIDANVYNGRITYEAFDYPIYNIRGRIVCEDDDWWLDRFEGRNDSGSIRCSGNWQSVRFGPVPFDLRFTALDVPIEEELKRALPQQAQFVWDELQPQGSIDNVSVHLQRLIHSQAVNTRIKIVEQSGSNASTGQSLRMRPRAFPYRLTDVDCEIDYTPEMVTIQKASGLNGASRISMRGICEPTQSGTWKANVEWLPQTRLWVETELLKALPKSIRESLVKIDFSGPISILGSSTVEFGKTREDPIASTWNCEMAVEEGKLGDGSQIGSMRGTLAMHGRSEGEVVHARGRINMDALTFLGIPVTNLQGPFALVGTDLYFGSLVYDVYPPKEPAMVESMTADALAGNLWITGNAKLGDNQGVFNVESRLEKADLNLLLQDVGVNSPTTEAVVDATLNFRGVPWNPQTYDGGGKIHLSDAHLYELPFMIRLMNVASVNPTSNSAFQTADIAFQIDGNRIPIDVSCEGEILWLRGEGETNLRRELQLDLYSYVGRRSSVAKVAGTLLPDSRSATFMLVEIGGTLDNPTMQRRAFPQIEASFQQIFPELAAKREANPLLPWRK